MTKHTHLPPTHTLIAMKFFLLRRKAVQKKKEDEHGNQVSKNRKETNRNRRR